MLFVKLHYAVDEDTDFRTYPQKGHILYSNSVYHQTDHCGFFITIPSCFSFMILTCFCAQGSAFSVIELENQHLLFQAVVFPLFLVFVACCYLAFVLYISKYP